MENHFHHWLVALMIAAVFHTAVALTLVRPPKTATARIDAIAIELAPGAGGSIGGQAGTSDNEDTGEPASNTAENERFDETPDEPDEPDEHERDPHQALDSLAEAAPAPTAEVVPPEPKPEPAVVEAPAPKPPATQKPKPEPEVVEKPKPEPEAVEKPKAEPRVVKKPRSKPKPAPKPPAEPAAAPKAAGESQAGTGEPDRVARDEGSAPGTGKKGSRKGSADSQARYYGELATWLNRHKRYPTAARRSRHTGTVRVTFTIDRNGRVLSKRIVSGSGHAALDQEVEAMLRRASPMPKIPRELGRSTLTVTLPVVFTLR